MSNQRTVLTVGGVLCAALVALYLATLSEPHVAATAERAEVREAQDADETELSAAPPAAREVQAQTDGVPAASPAGAAPAPTPAEARTVRVLVLTQTGESFRKATSSSPFLFTAVATRTQPGETWPPDAGPPIERCGELGFSGTDRERGVLGTIALRCEPPLWVSLLRGDRVLASQVLQPDADEVAFRLDPAAVLAEQCTLRFRTVDAATGEAATNVSGSLSGSVDVFSLSPDGDGRFVIEKVEPGTVKVLVTGKGYQPEERDVELVPGSDVDLGDIPMRTRDSRTLRVVVQRPADARQVEVRLLPLDWAVGPGEPLAPGLWKNDVEDDRDDVELQLDPGSWIVWAQGRSAQGTLRSPAVLVEIAQGLATTTVELVPTVRVTLRGGDAPCKVLVRDGAGRWAHEPEFVAAGGEAQLELVPGPHQLVVQVGGRQDRTLPLQVGAQAMELELP